MLPTAHEIAGRGYKQLEFDVQMPVRARVVRRVAAVRRRWRVAGGRREGRWM